MWYVILLDFHRGTKWSERSGQTAGREKHQVYAGTSWVRRGEQDVYNVHVPVHAYQSQEHLL